MNSADKTHMPSEIPGIAVPLHDHFPQVYVDL
jgi:hypothetical protein